MYIPRNWVHRYMPETLFVVFSGAARSKNFFYFPWAIKRLNKIEKLKKKKFFCQEETQYFTICFRQKKHDF